MIDMLEARLRLLARLRGAEHELAKVEQATTAAALMRGRSHELGNLIQIVKLSAEQLEQRLENVGPELAELATDLHKTAEEAVALLAQMFVAARPPARSERGPVVTHAVRAAVELARPAVASIDLRIELDDTVHTLATADELEAMVIAAVLEAATANRVAIVLRERVIAGKRWVELLRIDDRALGDGDLAHMFEPASLLHLVVSAAHQAGGDASIAPGRAGLELAIELPVAQSSSSSSYSTGS